MSHGIHSSALIAQINCLQAEVDNLNTRIAGLSNAATQRATETYERQVRERVLTLLLSADVIRVPESAVDEAETYVRYIVDGK